MTKDDKWAAMKQHVEESVKQMERDLPQIIQGFKDHPNNMANWYPTLQQVAATPKTVLVDIGYDIVGDYLNGVPHSPKAHDFRGRLRDAAESIGYPIFLRSGVMSAKHSWKDSCFIPKDPGPDGWVNHVYCILEMNAMAWGAPMPTCFAVREIIKTTPIFKAFWGEMPITREFRVFVRDGTVECIHPYWPSEAFTNEEMTAEKVEALEQMSFLHPVERELLTVKSTMVARSFPGSWSVDWLEDERKHWWCIDMATGVSSFHWKGCPHGH